MTSRSGDRRDRGRPSTSDTGSSDDDDPLARRLADLARDLQERPSPQEVMADLVAAVVTTVPGAQDCSISVVRHRRRVVSPASSGDLARRFDALQEETGQGPSFDVLLEHRTIRVDDLATDRRWPELAARAQEVGAASVLCVSLFVHRDDVGVLTVLAGAPAAFTDSSEHVGLIVATHAAVALADALELQGISSALATRDLIGQAKGILVERFKMTSDQAFTLLVRASQAEQRRLTDVAADLVRTGRLGG